MRDRSGWSRATTFALISAGLLSACRGTPPGAPTPAADPATVAVREVLRREATLDVNAIPPRAVAVPPMRVQGVDSTLAALGYGLADLLMTDLAYSAQLVVLDRSRVDAMLRELDLVRAGQVDSAHAPRVGRLLGARHLVVGSLTGRGRGELGIDARMANVVSGSLATAVSARAPIAEILDAEKAIAYRVFDALGITLTPGERANIEQRPTGNVTALLAYSRGVRDEAFGDYAAAAANYRAALAADPNFRAARSRLDHAQALLTASTAPQTLRGLQAATSSTGSGAVGLAAGAINPSPVSGLAGGGASATQQRATQSDRGVEAQRQAVYTTVIINVRQLP